MQIKWKTAWNLRILLSISHSESKMVFRFGKMSFQNGTKEGLEGIQQEKNKKEMERERERYRDAHHLYNIACEYMYYM